MPGRLDVHCAKLGERIGSPLVHDVNPGSAMNHCIDPLQGLRPGLRHAQPIDERHLDIFRELHAGAPLGGANLHIIFLAQASQHASADKTGRARE